MTTGNQHPSAGMPNQQTIIIREPVRASNGMGTAGFVLALIGFFLSWVPILGWIIWLLGLIFSFVGVFKAPRGLAIAGLVISLLAFIVLIALVGIIAAAIGITSFV